MRWRAADYWKFWASDLGQKVAAGFIGFSTFSGFMAHALPNGFFKERYAEVFQAYENGFPVELKPEVRKRAEAIVQKVFQLDRERNIGFFTAYGYDPCTIGTTKLRFGALVGLPQNFNYEKVSDIKVEDLTLRDKPFPTSHEKAHQFLETLLLSPAAKDFLVARELRLADSYVNVHLRSSLTALAVFLVYLWSFKYNRRLNLFARPFKWRLTLYTLLGSVVGVMRMAFGDMLTYKSEENGDEFAANLGPEFAAGGVEYYTKALERNVLLRELLGPKVGESCYTPVGNEPVFIRSRHVPLTARKEAMEKKLEEWRTKRKEASLGQGLEKVQQIPA